MWVREMWADTQQTQTYRLPLLIATPIYIVGDGGEGIEPNSKHHEFLFYL